MHSIRAIARYSWSDYNVVHMKRALEDEAFLYSLGVNFERRGTWGKDLFIEVPYCSASSRVLAFKAALNLLRDKYPPVQYVEVIDG